MRYALLPPRRAASVDWRSVGLGAVLVAALATGFAAGAAALVRHSLDPDTGPTGAALSEGLTAFGAAGLGVAIGGAITAALSRRGRWVADGVLAAAVGYCLVAVVAAATGPDDMTHQEHVEFALTFAAPAIVLGALGAALMTVLRREKASDRCRRPASR